jgi:autotransporter-associated beta strand protein
MPSFLRCLIAANLLIQGGKSHCGARPMVLGEAGVDVACHMKTYDSSSSWNEEPPSMAKRHGLLRIVLAIFAGLFFWAPQASYSTIVNYLGSGALDEKKSWSTQNVPTSSDSAVFHVGNSTIRSKNSLNFGNFVWDNNTSSTISLNANGIVRYLTLSGGGGGEATIKAGGSERDLLLMGVDAKSNTLKFEAIPGNGELQIKLDADGNINVLNPGATLDISTVITGSKSLSKTGDGTLIFGSANTYTGSTTIKSGTLKANATNSLGSSSSIDIQGGSLLVAASDTLNDKADILMGNAKLELSGKDITEYVGALTLTGNSVIDVRELQGGKNALHFASSYLEEGWGKNTSLSIWNWDFSRENHIYFGSDSKGLSTNQLQQISFYSDFGNSFIGNAFISNSGEISTIPEAHTIVGATLILLGAIAHFMTKRDNGG